MALGHDLEVAALDRIIAAEHERFLARMPRSAEYTEKGQQLAGGRSHLQLADLLPPPDLGRARVRFAALRCRRKRVRRLPRRLRGHAGRPCPSGHRQSGDRAGRPWHPLRPTGPRRDGGGGPPVRTIRPAPLALRKQRHRGDDGCDPPDASRDRPRPHHQVRRRIPRSSRLRPGLDLVGRRPRAVAAAAVGGRPRRESPTPSSNSPRSLRSTISRPLRRSSKTIPG